LADYVTPEFTQDLQTKSPQQIVQDYGTHVMVDKFDAKYIYGSYNLLIKQKRLRFNATTDMLADYVTPEFTQDLQTKSPQQIVQDYGTHVMVD
ncbi:hypothetical protein, partial [Chryseobacterium sp. CH1]|uniref:hypothetical protein n=1 Tax=Chryseobacterium sp. CH1 TaxID=713551 RepID=UPI00102834E0